ncbi:MAG: hypothetical protein DCF29_15550 [Alphaproteobacteria bacterium]|nr:MAG: hypothetical protein DCF29_15550 [Alphaproteobacteria bacterium]
MQDPIADAPPFVEKDPTPVFLFVCEDGPNALAARLAHLTGHLAHVETHWRRYIVAGPMRQPNKTTICGSYFLLRAADIDEAWAIMRGDPYVTSELYFKITVTDVTPSIGLYVGGKIWTDAAAIIHQATRG